MKTKKPKQMPVKYELFHQHKGNPNFLFHTNKHELGSGHFIVIGTEKQQVFHFAFLNEFIPEKKITSDTFWQDMANRLSEKWNTSVRYDMYKDGYKVKTYSSKNKKK